MPAFFQASSKRKQAAYVSGEPSANNNERGGSKNPGAESKFLKHRKEELKSQEELKKDEQKLLRKKDFFDEKTGEIVEIGTLPYNSIDVKYSPLPTSPLLSLSLSLSPLPSPTLPSPPSLSPPPSSSPFSPTPSQLSKPIPAYFSFLVNFQPEKRVC